jgi:hypothetical protein
MTSIHSVEHKITSEQAAVEGVEVWDGFIHLEDNPFAAKNQRCTGIDHGD